MKNNILSILPHNTPEIIREASKTQMSVLVLLLLGIISIGFFFFKKSSDKIKIGVFISLLICAIALCSFILGNQHQKAQTTEFSNPVDSIYGTIQKPVNASTVEPVSKTKERQVSRVDDSSNRQNLMNINDNHGVVNTGVINGPTTVNNK